MDLDERTPTLADLIFEANHLAEDIERCTETMLTAMRGMRFHADNRNAHQRSAERRAAYLTMQLHGANDMARKAELTLHQEDDPELSFELNEARGEELLLAQDKWDFERAQLTRQNLRDQLKVATAVIYAIAGRE